MLVHLNGQLVEHDRAMVSPFDRGFLFGDGVYEGLRAFQHAGRRRVVAIGRHVQRLARGLAETGIDWDASRMPAICDQLLDACGLNDAFVYVQITRGTPDLSAGPVRVRVPTRSLQPTVFAYASPLPPIDFVHPVPARKKAALAADVRWHKGHIKGVSLLGNIMAALEAHAGHQAEEVILYRESGGRRLVSEGTYTNVMIVPGSPASAPRGSSAHPEVLTPDLASTSILNGVTRSLLLNLDPHIREAEVTVEHLGLADEVLLIGTTTMVTAVTHLDGKPIGNPAWRGREGPTAARLARLLAGALRDGRDESDGT